MIISDVMKECVVMTEISEEEEEEEPLDLPISGTGGGGVLREGLVIWGHGGRPEYCKTRLFVLRVFFYDFLVFLGGILVGWK